MKEFKPNRKLLLASIDTLIYLFVASVFFILSRISDSSSVKPVGDYLISCAVFYVCIVAMRLALRVYSNVWRYANAYAYLQIVIADGTAAVLGLLLTYFPFEYRFHLGVWQSFSVVALTNILTLTSRFCYQYLYNRFNVNSAVSNKINVAIIGAGTVGFSLANELLFSSNSHYRPLCFIDSNKEKAGNKILNLPVYAPDENILERLKNLPIQEIVIAITSLNSDDIRRFYNFYSPTGCKIKMYDFPLSEAVSGKRVLREVRIEDLLFRDTVDMSETEKIKEYYANKRVLVTGGGGSIGSELCRQIAAASPSRLIIYDIYENNAYDIQQELLIKHGKHFPLSVEIGSVRDTERLEAVFAAYRPEIVLHAAAHKHVPLMEHSNTEAIKNNVFGTLNTADLAEKYGAQKFILISTDKAVNPTNIMGATKRMCEIIVQCRTDSKTSFSAVRFGNVLGSNGSVIPLFKKQIANGGPVTITDKRITRFFMTIPEASQLVLQAGALAKRGELFVLDMGKPVKIIDLAESIIRLSGLIPYQDIGIVETGLRPGEKLYEELLIKSETLDKTENDLIFIEKDTPFSREEVETRLNILRSALEQSSSCSDSEIIKKALKSVVPTYRDPDEVNQQIQTV